jgi:hypothetical protein
MHLEYGAVGEHLEGHFGLAMKIYSICSSLIVEELKIVAQPHRQRSHWSTGDSGLSDGVDGTQPLGFHAGKTGTFHKAVQPKYILINDVA